MIMTPSAACPTKPRKIYRTTTIVFKGLRIGKLVGVTLDEEKARNVIMYLVFKSPRYLSTSRLQKMAYLAELEFYREYGERLTGAEFYNHYYGPYSFDLEKVTVEMEGDTILMEIAETEKGEAIFHRPDTERINIELSGREKSILDEVVNEWKFKPTQEIVQAAKSTTPFLSSRKGDKINFSVILNYKEKEKALAEYLEKKSGA